MANLDPQPLQHAAAPPGQNTGTHLPTEKEKDFLFIHTDTHAEAHAEYPPCFFLTALIWHRQINSKQKLCVV